VVLRRSQARHGFSEADGSHDQQVHVAARRVTVGRDGAEHDGEVNPAVTQGFSEHVREAFRLEHNVADGLEKRVPIVCAQVPSIAGPALGQQAGRDELVNLRLDAPGSESGEPHQFAEVELPAGVKERLSEDGPPGIGAQQK
jgi:hypothetical protein